MILCQMTFEQLNPTILMETQSVFSAHNYVSKPCFSPENCFVNGAKSLRQDLGQTVLLTFSPSSTHKLRTFPQKTSFRITY